MLIKRWILLTVILILMVWVVAALDRNPAAVILPSAFSDDNASSADGRNVNRAAFVSDDETGSNVRPSLSLSHDEHFYPSSIEVSISASIPDAVIYYTLDGSEPTYDSQIYTAPIALDTPSESDESIAVYPLKAIAVTGEMTFLTGADFFLTDLYQNIFERSPDSNEYDEKITALLDGKVTAAEVVYDFVFSPQTAAKDLDDEAFVETLYLAFFGRESDPDGKAHWVNALSSGTAREQAFLAFASSAEFDRVCDNLFEITVVQWDAASLTLVHTYFIGSEFDDRFDVMVFSLSTDDKHLYDYDTGILVEGRLRDEYLEKNPGVSVNHHIPANFNIRGMDGERPIYVEVFESGKRVLAQSAGIRVHGVSSRVITPQKSLRLIARNAYEAEPGQGRFSYDFFPDDVKADYYGTPITRYDQLILSNIADDRNGALLRQEVMYNLAWLSGFRVVSPARAASVFLNGEYYGFSWLEVRINEQYLQDVYSAPTRDFQIMGNAERLYHGDDVALIAAMEELSAFLEKDFTDDKILAEFESLVDLDNFMCYYAFQSVIGNRDWPNNNLRRWRYIGSQTDEERNPLDLAPELDGRWRYVIFDLDKAMGLWYEVWPLSNSPPFTDYITDYVYNDSISHMLRALLARPDMADKFAMYACDIAANIVTPENVAKYINEFYDEAYNEIGYALDAGKYADWVSRDTIEQNHNNMIAYTAWRTADHIGALREHFEWDDEIFELHGFSVFGWDVDMSAKWRRGEYLEGMRRYFDWDDEMFTVQVSGGDAVIGTQTAASSTYFAHLTIPVKPALSKYAVFDHWVLNGEIIYTDEITVSAADATNGIVSITLVTREETPTLSITQAYGSSSRNGAALQNASDTAIETTHLYFTDDLHNPFMWAMPLATVEPGGALEFAGRGSNDGQDIHRIRMGFNVREGRVLYLCGEEGSVLDWMVVNAAP
ncbi:MAG: CotH kinase family protein [Oscillospiraceae bacterium]|nr:CotH kinase family protein [Oscillospiraceae bacterium]